MTRSAMTVAVAALVAACLANPVDGRSLRSLQLSPDSSIDDDCMVVIIEAESLESFGSWSVVQDSAASGGEYITWEGDDNEDPEEGDIITTTIGITLPGTYTVQWLMRQPSGSRSSQANDAWLNFPDALRFGHLTSNTIYDGFVKVFGSANNGDFEYDGTAAEDGIRSEIAVEFLEPGDYAMEIAGRSSGFQLDQIILFEHTLAVDVAAAGCRGGDRNPIRAPTPSPVSSDDAQDESGAAVEANGSQDDGGVEADGAQDDDDSTDSGGAPDGAFVDDIVRIIEVNGRNPGGVGWADSYSVGDRCYMYTNLDHGIDSMLVDTPRGEMTILELYEVMDRGPGFEGHPLYNDIQCGNGPLNDVADEFDCPGLVEHGEEGCGQIGPMWDLSELEEPDEDSEENSEE